MATQTVDAPANNEQALEDNPFAEQAAQEARKPKKASLFASIITGKTIRPVFTIVYGGPGVGKTTFGAGADSPIFLPTERGTDQVGATRFPLARTYLEFKKQLHAIDTEPHDFKTCVIDTADGLEALIHAEVCEEKKVDSIEQVGWQDGYKAAKTRWRKLLNKLVDMSERINVLVLCHAHVKSFTDPALSNPYDIWQMRLHPTSADVLREACDNILFATYDVEIVKENKKAAKGRGINSGERVLRTTAATGFEAKNRYNLPDEIPLEWSALSDGVREFYAK